MLWRVYAYAQTGLSDAISNEMPYTGQKSFFTHRFLYQSCNNKDGLSHYIILYVNGVKKVRSALHHRSLNHLKRK